MIYRGRKGSRGYKGNRGYNKYNNKLKLITLKVIYLGNI